MTLRAHSTRSTSRSTSRSTPRFARLAAVLPLLAAPAALAADTAALERRIAALQAELDQARAALIEAKEASEAAYTRASEAEQQLAEAGAPSADKITFGPLTIGGALRANYVLGSYPNRGSSGAYPNTGPSRGGNGGDFELETFRINMDLQYENLIGKLEYRWYNGYNFLHTGWLGWAFDDGSRIEVGQNRVPFGSMSASPTTWT